MTWKTPLVRKAASLLSRRRGILSHLLADARVADEALRSTRMVQAMFGANGPWRALFRNPEIRHRLGLNLEAVDWVEDGDYAEHKGREGLMGVLELAQKKGVLTVSDLAEIAGTPEVLRALPPERLLAPLTPEQILAHLTPEQMLGHLTPEQILAHLTPEQMLGHLSPEQVMDYLTPQQMLNRLTPAQMLAELTLEQILAHITPEQMLEKIGRERILAHIGPLASLNGMTVADAAGQQSFLDLLRAVDSEGKAAVALIAGDERVAKRLVASDDALKQVLKLPEATRKLRLLQGVERAAALPYALPAAVVSYPRSGSNFFQSILSHSTGMQNISLYASDPLSFVPLLSVKSHALSPAYMRDEFSRLLDVTNAPGRIILLKRDPRDVMISFYEYTQAQRQTPIAQEDFLENIDFFYASTIDKNYGRHVDQGPLSVIDAYRKHVRKWFVDRGETAPLLALSYEDLVDDPARHFRAALDFLEIDLPAALSFLDVKVSQYSGEDRPRARSLGWKASGTKYEVLLSSVSALLKEEIQALGYETEESMTSAAPERLESDSDQALEPSSS